MEIKAAKVIEDSNETLLIQSSSFPNTTGMYQLNGENYTPGANDLFLKKEDSLMFKDGYEKVKHYERGDEIMTCEEFETTPTSFDEYTEDDEVVARIANKKKLEGFKAILIPNKFEPVKFKVVGDIEKTGSVFITCKIKSIRYNNEPVIYSINGSAVAMDEYMNLKEKHKEQATFQTPKRSYLRFVQVNGNYAFSDHFPFGDWGYRSDHISLKEAQEKEADIRNRVRNAVEAEVFKAEISNRKKLQILGQLKIAREMKTKKSTNEVLELIIADIQYYMSIVKG